MVTEDDLTLSDGHTMKYTDHVSQKYTLKTYIILLTMSPQKLCKKEIASVPQASRKIQLANPQEALETQLYLHCQFVVTLSPAPFPTPCVAMCGGLFSFGAINNRILTFIYLNVSVLCPTVR